MKKWLEDMKWEWRELDIILKILFVFGVPMIALFLVALIVLSKGIVILGVLAIWGIIKLLDKWSES